MSRGKEFQNFKFFELRTYGGDIAKTEVTAACFGRSYLIICDSEGYIKACDRSMKTVASFKAYGQFVTHVRPLMTRNVVVTLGDDDEVNTGIVRIWDLEQLDGAGGRPHHREHRLFKFPEFPPPNDLMPLRLTYNDELAKILKFNRNHNPVTSEDDRLMPRFVSTIKTSVVSFDVSEDLQHLAAGLTSNEIVVMKGDLERGSTTIKMKRLKSAFTDGNLSYIAFLRQRPSDSAAAATTSNATTASFSHILFVVYTNTVTVWRSPLKGDYQEFSTGCPFGSLPECCAMNEQGQLAVADSGSTSLVAFFGGNDLYARLRQHWDPDDLKPVAFEDIPGVKKKVGFHKHFLLVLTQAENRADKSILSLYDCDNAIKAFSEALHHVAWIIPDVSQLLVVSQGRYDSKAREVLINQKVHKLIEADLQEKLKQLFERECFTKAVDMAKRMQLNDVDQHSIYKRYGDHLLRKGDFKGAIEQYKRTIGSGSVEPSFVIRQFLDAQRIKYLTEYLEELHKEKYKIANKNHTTLLLNCYTKLHDGQKLKEFITNRNNSFDASNAIKVCRQAGYFDEATMLAEQYHQPEDYVKIQLENLNDPETAIRFIRELPVDEAEAILKAHGKTFIFRLPSLATQCLIDLCTGKWKVARRLGPGSSSSSNQHASSLAAGGLTQPNIPKPPGRAHAFDFIHAFVDAPLYMLQFLVGVESSGILNDDFSDSSTDLHTAQRAVYNTLIELYLTKDLKVSIKPLDAAAASTMAGGGAGMEGLAATSIAGGGSILGGDAAAIAEVGTLADRRARALTLIQQYADRYDAYHVLALVQQHNFEEGILFLFNSLNLHHEVFLHHAKVFEQRNAPIASRLRAKEALLQTCRSQAGTGTDAERELWISLLSLFVRSDLETVSEDVTLILDHIEEQDLLPPVAVIAILSSNPTLKLKAVRSYIIKTLKKDSASIKAHQKTLEENTSKASKLFEEVRQLQTSATVFQTTKCAKCSAALDLPAIHFLCRHSFHKRCLNDTMECNLCAPHTKQLMVEQRELEAKAQDHAAFFHEVERAKDGFGAVAGFFGTATFAGPQLRREALLVGTTADAFSADVDERGDIDDVDGVLNPLDELDHPENVEAW